LRPVAAQVKRDQEQTLLALAARDARETRAAFQKAQEGLIKARLDVFHSLMNQARERQAYEVAQQIREDLTFQGQPVPTSVTAAYWTALRGYHLREVREIRRMTEERWLATLLRVEKSHIPFPDEPPVEFPGPAVIREITRDKFNSWADWSQDRLKR